jgi:hypothetical protein
MISVDPTGTAERMVARILFKELRAGSGIAAKYSFTVFAFFADLRRLGIELRLLDFAFFMLAILPEWRD